MGEKEVQSHHTHGAPLPGGVEDTAVKKPYPMPKEALWIPTRIAACLTSIHLYIGFLWRVSQMSPIFPFAPPPGSHSRPTYYSDCTFFLVNYEEFKQTRSEK